MVVAGGGGGMLKIWDSNMMNPESRGPFFSLTAKKQA